MSKSEKDKSDVLEEHIYTIPLRKINITSKKNRAPKSVKIIKDFIIKHMKTEDVLITAEVNEKIWLRGKEGIPRRIKIRAVKEKSGIVKIFLSEGSQD